MELTPDLQEYLIKNKDLIFKEIVEFLKTFKGVKIQNDNNGVYYYLDFYKTQDYDPYAKENGRIAEQKTGQIVKHISVSIKKQNRITGRDFTTQISFQVWIDRKKEIPKYQVSWFGPTERIGSSCLSFFPFVLDKKEFTTGYYQSICLYMKDTLDVIKRHKPINKVNYDLIKKLMSFFQLIINKYGEKLVEEKKNLKGELQLLNTDGNGLVNIVESGKDFMKVLTKHQKEIIAIDRSYIQKFIKLSNHLKSKRQNIQEMYGRIMDSDSTVTKIELMNLLKNQIHNYELLTLHSLSMVMSLVKDDMITFYEIYESFDKHNVFNTNWENEVSQKLSDINVSLSELMYSIQKMEENITEELNNLVYVTEEGFYGLNDTIEKELRSVKSSIQFNNLLTGIQTYQLYKINKQTKGLIN